MKTFQIQLLVALALCSIVMGDIIRVPLQHKRHATSRFRLRDAQGQETDVVNIDALRREVAKINKRYGGSGATADDDEAAAAEYEKRWVHAENIHQDSKIADDDDNIASDIAAMIKDTVGAILPSHQSKTQQQADSYSGARLGQANQSGKSQTVKGATGDASAAVPLSVSTHNGNDFEFVGEVKIGSPAQTFKINPDTGSADLWVVDVECTADDCGPDARGKYSSKASSSYKTISGKKFDLQYGIGSVSGRFARDTVQFDSLKINKQTIGLANKTSSDWKDDAASGVLGLGFRSITSGGQRTVIQNMATQNKLKKQVVSFAFGRSKSGTQGKSELLFGDINRSLIKGKVSYYKLSKVGYWQTGFTSFAPKGTKGVSKQDAILDTGTSLIAASSKQAAAFWKGVKGSAKTSDGSYYTFPCDTKINAQLTMPDGRSFTVSEEDINMGKEAPGSDKCIGSVLTASTPNAIIMGLTMLKNAYQVYDFTGGNERIGLAQYNF